MSDEIRYFDTAHAGIDAMKACTSRSYPRHSHDQYGIGVIDAGGHSSWSGRGQVEAGPRGTICCNPGEVTDGRAVAGVPRAWRMMYLEPSLVEGLFADVLERNARDVALTEPSFFCDATRTAFDHAFGILADPVASKNGLAVETALIGLVARLRVRSTLRGHRPSVATGAVRAAKDRIDADPAAPVTLMELANATGLSRYQLLRAFARDLGITPHAYVLQRRLELARQLLRARCSAAETAVRAGFHDQPHLTRAFQRQFGVTPRRYAARLP
ncbi:MAG: bacterial regulatory helix-turn-helix, AraC family protein [Gemmatimonadetes bacterium]|nr:bacterial regulatory helix-turn-helix, AraC family protein [Gemmatimonadota bacterium]